MFSTTKSRTSSPETCSLPSITPAEKLTVRGHDAAVQHVDRDSIPSAVRVQIPISAGPTGMVKRQQRCSYLSVFLCACHQQNVCMRSPRGISRPRGTKPLLLRACTSPVITKPPAVIKIIALLSTYLKLHGNPAGVCFLGSM